MGKPCGRTRGSIRVPRSTILWLGGAFDFASDSDFASVFAFDPDFDFDLEQCRVPHLRRAAFARLRWEK
jgi:hypothetical protein